MNSEGSEQNQPCQGQKRPGTPDLSMEKGGQTTAPSAPTDEMHEIVSIYDSAKESRTFYVELGMGWTVDPLYAVGKKLMLFCTAEEVWHHGMGQAYREDKGVHVVQFDDGKTLTVPLAGVRVRVLMQAEAALPPRPSLGRMYEVYSVLNKGITQGWYKKGYMPGLAQGMDKLKKALVTEAQHILETKGEDIDDTEDVIQTAQRVIASVVDNANPHVCRYFPSWLETTEFRPGQPVWAKAFKHPHWPGLVVSPDHMLNEQTCNRPSSKHQYVAVYFFGSYDRILAPIDKVYSFGDGIRKGCHLVKQKKYWPAALEEIKAYAKDGVIPSSILTQFDFAYFNADGQNTLPLKKKESVAATGGSSKKRSKIDQNEKISKYFKKSKSDAMSNNGDGSSEADAVLRRLNVKNFRVHNLGEIVWNNPQFHSESYIWPLGYKVERKMKSVFSPAERVEHVIEILPPKEKNGEPVFRITVDTVNECEAIGSSIIFHGFLQSLPYATSQGSWYNAVGARVLGLDKANVFQAILALPNAIKCQNLGQQVKKKIESIMASAVKVPVSDPSNSLLQEMALCQLPAGVKAVKMGSTRPFECEICGDVEEDEEDYIIQCDGCKSCVHMSCYCVKEAPHGSLWLCDVCKSHPKENERPACAICPVSGGAMKRTTCGKWCHPVCALWLPETVIMREATHLHLNGLVEGIDLIHKSRRGTKCCICKQRYGAVVQCCAEGPECYSAFHYMCAKSHGCDHELVYSDGEDDDDDFTASDGNSSENQESGPHLKKQKRQGKKKQKKGTVISGGRLMAFCPKHSTNKALKSRNSSSNDASNSIVEIEEPTFRHRDAMSWILNCRNNKMFKKSYVQPQAMALGGPCPTLQSTGHCSVPKYPASECITDMDGLVSKSGKKDGVKTVTASWDMASAKRIRSMSENFNSMNASWKKYVLPGKSAIHGWGAFTTKRIKEGDMVIEYVGELVRPSVAEMREMRLYDTLVGAGTYVFRLNTEFCVDATRSGNLAHLLNHSCSPNCASRTISVKDANSNPVDHVIIFALRDIEPGEELTYDYRFCGEEILPCSCGAPECRSMVNHVEPLASKPFWAPASKVKSINLDQIFGNTKLLRASRFPVCSGLRRLSLMSAPSRAHGSSYSKSLPMRDVSFTSRAIDRSSASVRIGGARGFRTSVVTAALKNGIVGLPNVGKSTMFNAICENGKAQAANFPFCTIEPNVGMVAVPDPRLDALAEIANSQRTVPTSVEFVDIAGLVKGASKGEGLGNQFLANIRECDSIVQVVRCFDNDDVVHVAGKVDPLEDTDVINFELALSDVAQIEKRMEKLKKGRAPKPEEKKQNEMEAAALQKILDALEQGLPARSVELNEDEESLVKVLCLLTKKPMIYAANVGEEDLANQGADNVHVQALKKKAAAEGSDVVVVSAQVEAELNELEPAEAAEYLNDLGVEEGGLKSLIRATYKQLGLLTYFTTGEQETRAWTVRMGSTAPQAAGVIHTDFEKGFIRAETVAYDDYISAGGFSGAKEKGVLRLEGKEYIVNEGDILTFRFAN